MKRLLDYAMMAGVVLLLMAAASAFAQTAPGVAGEAMPGQGAVAPATSTVTGRQIKLPEVLTLCASGVDYVVCSSGGGGGGGGDASATNQQAQITAANLTNTRLGDITAPAAGSANARLGQINTGVAGVTAALPTRDGNGDLRVPIVTVTSFYVAIAANTSTEILAASTVRVGYELQCTGNVAVGISRTHAPLSSATPASGGADLVVPAGSFPAYIPAYVSGLGMTAYATSATACWGVNYARQ